MSRDDHRKRPAKLDLKVLLVEDAETDAELTLFELKRYGFIPESRRVWTEEGFRSALAAFLPDIILSDYSMPTFDGMWALQIARTLAPEVPFIFLSGTIRKESALEALHSGASDYLVKDDLAELGGAVEKLMRAKKN